MILDSMQVKREILKVVPLEVGQGGLHAGELRVPMMFICIFNFSCKTRRSVS